MMNIVGATCLGVWCQFTARLDHVKNPSKSLLPPSVILNETVWEKNIHNRITDEKIHATAYTGKPHWMCLQSILYSTNINQWKGVMTAQIVHSIGNVMISDTLKKMSCDIRQQGRKVSFTISGREDAEHSYHSDRLHKWQLVFPPQSRSSDGFIRVLYAFVLDQDWFWIWGWRWQRILKTATKLNS